MSDELKSNSEFDNGEILIYENQSGAIKVDVRLEDETVWLTQAHMAQLFGKAKSTINEHIKNIFAEGELVETEVMKLKNTDIEQFYLVIQFTINADKNSFNLSYIGKEVVQKDGKVKNDALYFADSTIKNIFQDKDTMSYVAPAVIKAKAQRFNNIAVGEILDNYKYFNSIKWDSSKSNFIGTLELDNNAKKSNIKQQQVEYLYSSSGGSICIISGGRFRLTKEYSNGQKESCSLPKEDLMQTLINNKKSYYSGVRNKKTFSNRV